MTTATTHALRLTRTVRVSPERAFRAWIDPADMKQWYCPEGGTVGNVEVDPEVGGRYRVVMEMPDRSHIVTGVYREIDSPRRIVFTWRWEEEDDQRGHGESLVTVEFEDRGDETTEVILTHEKLETAESRDGHESGWASALNRYEALLG